MRKNQENRAFNHRNRKIFTNVHFELYSTIIIVNEQISKNACKKLTNIVK